MKGLTDYMSLAVLAGIAELNFIPVLCHLNTGIPQLGWLGCHVITKLIFFHLVNMPRFS